MNLAITVAPSALSDIDAVTGRLARAGMTVEQVLSATGVIIGTADPSIVPALARLTGVASVEPDANFRLKPEG